ncbi:O-antigen ligase family protein [Polynucleobacter paneuropaeus]|nr:O-antigen ligase family protein [Polynucleobacter paneuropaeus]
MKNIKFSEKSINRLILVGGLQNLWQLGAIYPLNLVATLYFISKARFKINNSLDALIGGYFLAGLISIFSGLIIALFDEMYLKLFPNAFKSFFVFSWVLVFFGAYNFKIEDFYKIVLWLIGATSIGIFFSYLYIYLNQEVSLYQTRSMISWCSGWPQRWVMFSIIGHFVFLCRYENCRRIFDLILSIICLTITILSATRSAVIGVVAGYLVLSVLSRKNLLFILGIVLITSLLGSFFIDQIQDALRISEIIEYSPSQGADGSSLNNRIHNLWPGIIDSLGISRIPFGWGHVGVAYIPHSFFLDTRELSDIPGQELGTAESEYMDILLRQGVVGLFLFLMILILGIKYAYQLYRLDEDQNRRTFWKASLAWQVGIVVHGITVETIRLPLYNLFFFLFLGIISNSYYQLTTGRNDCSGRLRSKIVRGGAIV